jgi:hypothetical protein
MLDALHVTNGDSTVPALRDTGLASEILVWRDALHEGPVPDVADAELRRIRAAFLASVGASDIGLLAEFEERDRRLAAPGRDGRYVLWFEADLYDQLQLVQILAMLHGLGVPAGRITLICIGEHVGIAHFGGLGELEADQLARLPAHAATVLSTGALDDATAAWRALRSSDPMALNDVAAAPSAELRFVAEAFERLSREYPSTRDGLSITERRILAGVATGATTAGGVFAWVMAREARPFLGDTWCFDRIAGLRDASVPLLSGAPGPVSFDTTLGLTEAGRRVLAGRDDHVALSGIDRWIGGVHLSGRAVPWRWDDATERIIGR